jgi:WD40 repeat protein
VRTLLVVLDQFEDYFLYHGDGGADEFATQLIAIVNEPNLRVNVLLSIRDDAWAKLDRFEGQIPHLFANYIRVEHLNRSAGREAIERPVEEWNRGLPETERSYRLDTDLVEAVLDAAATGGLVTRAGPSTLAPEEIEAPFLQLVLQRLWRATVAAGSHELTRATLEQLGGAQQIVENHLLEALAGLTGREQAIASTLFRFLVTQSKTKIAHSAADLADWARQPEPEVTAVLETLCRGESGRILRRVPPAKDWDSPSYELFHDVLAEPIVEWRRGFEQERARRAAVRRLVRVGSSLLSLVAVFAALGIWALVQRSDAKRSARSAASLALASESGTQLGGHVERSLLLALDAYTASPNAESAGAMVAALESPDLADVEAIVRGGSDGVRALAFGPDGHTLATADFDGTLRLWDLPARRPLGEPLRESIGEVWSIAFAPGGRVLAAAGADGTVRLWDTKERRLLRATPPAGGAVRSVAFDPEGRLLASAGDGGAVWLRDPRSLAPIGEPLRDHAGRIISIAFSGDGQMLAAAGFDQVVRLWDVRTRRLLGRLAYRGKGPVLSVAFSPDGRRLAASCEDGTVRVADTRSLRFVGSPLDAHAGAVWGVAFGRSGRTLAASGFDGTVRLWDARSGSPLGVLHGHTRALTALAFSPDGRTLASASYDGTARLWAVPPRNRLPVLLRPTARQTVAVAFSPDRRMLASGGFQPTLRLWDLTTDRPTATVADVGSVESLAFSPGGRLIATGGDAGDVRLWRAPSLTPIGRPLTRGTGAVHGVSFSPNGKLLAAAGDDGRVRIWRLPDRTPVASPTAGSGQAWGVAFSGDGDTLAWTRSDGTVRLWSVRHQRSLGRLPLGARDLPLCVAFSPDGLLLAVGEVDGRIRLWDVHRHRWEGEPLKGPAARVERVAFAPNGSTLITAADDGTVRLWDVRAHKQLGRPLDGRGGTVLGVAVSPDGRTIASAHHDGAVLLWQQLLWTDLGDLRATVCRRVVGDLTRSEWNTIVPGLPYRTSC